VRWFRLGAAFLTALLLVGACATHALHTLERPDVQRNVFVAVGYGDPGPFDDWIGLSTPWQHQAQTIQIKPNMTPTMTHRVVAHELLHAAGYRAHIPDGKCDCYFNATADQKPLGPPCPAEVVKIRRVTRQYTVVVIDHGLLTAVLWATAMWNEAAGRVVFVVVE